MGMLGHLRQPPGQQFDLGRQPLEDPVLGEDIQAGQAHRGPQGIAGIGVPVEKRLELLEFPQEGLIDVVRGQGGGQGQVAPGDALGQT